MFIDYLIVPGFVTAAVIFWYLYHNDQELDRLSFEYQLRWTRYLARRERVNKKP